MNFKPNLNLYNEQFKMWDLNIFIYGVLVIYVINVRLQRLKYL